MPDVCKWHLDVGVYSTRCVRQLASVVLNVNNELPFAAVCSLYSRKHLVCTMKLSWKLCFLRNFIA